MGKKLEAYKEELYDKLVSIGAEYIAESEISRKKVVKNADDDVLMLAEVYLDAWDDSCRGFMAVMNVSSELFKDRDFLNDAHERYEEQRKNGAEEKCLIN